ncbi:hypothetical protein J7F01_09940 [Streptomyces sp. ISL-22]|nr:MULTISPECIES: hypothetical protein [unclassified Streptomyces]MBT2423491.1 hypothetical protein [Streptomyces sp. ISL-24]MBT2432516.1 hypothetical protein [Streptomyces sp. ISL-22]
MLWGTAVFLVPLGNSAANGGIVGVVVINSAREAVWASYFNDGTWAPGG